MLTPVILSGGAGSRLWPLSRANYPKQIVPLTGEESLLRRTLDRARGLAPEARPIVVCNEAHRFLVAQELHDAGMEATVVLEPEGRNTAPATALAALIARTEDPEAALLVLPADQHLGDGRALAAAVGAAATAAAEGALATFGVTPRSPHTGYGYIRRGEPRRGGAYAVARFVEKPDAAAAADYLAGDDYYWNSGMFLFAAARYLEELGKHAPGILEACGRAIDGATHETDFVRPEPQAFLASPANSIDYAIMERTDAAVVVPLDTDWSDLGSWDSIYEHLDRDAEGNAKVGDVVTADCRGSLFYANHRLIGAAGLEDHIVVETKDAVLVVPRGAGEAVKHLHAELAAREREEIDFHREVHRPWGSFDSTDQGEGFQVKRLTVKPGAVLSLQMHHHRAEHWVVVSGTARVTRDDEVLDLQPNEHIHIPLGAKHRIENPGEETLRIIEVQVGDYLGEDDIVRFEDKYGREGTTG